MLGRGPKLEFFQGGPDTALLQCFHRALVRRPQLYLPQRLELPRVQVENLLVIFSLTFFCGARKHWLMHPLYDAFEL